MKYGLMMRLSKADWLLGLAGAYCVISVMMNPLCAKPMSFGAGFAWMDNGIFEVLAFARLESSRPKVNARSESKRT